MTTGTLFLACLLLAASPGPPDADFLNQRGFKIPTRIDPSRRGEIRELELYVSTNQGQGWSKASAVSPDSPEFEFNAPNDGLYWFCVLVVDQQGRKDPPDPYSAKEFLKLFIDTVRPDLRIVAAERQGDEIVVKWEVREENPDPASVKLEYRTPEMPPNQWSPVPLPAAGTMQVAFRPGSLGAVQLRMQAQDLAHNPGTAQTEVAAVVGTASFAPPPGGSGPPIVPPPPPAITPKSVPAMPASQEKQPPPPTFPAGPSDVSPPVAGPATSPGAAVVAKTGGPATPDSPFPPPGAGAKPPRESAPMLYVNTRQVLLDYEVANLGVSGIKGVDVYLTRDDGRTWLPWTAVREVNPSAADPRDSLAATRRAVLVDVPGEGPYGFYLVVRSGVGLTKPPPQAGMPPRIRLEVDTTLPEAELYQPQLAPDRHGALVLSWKATDRNLAGKPITLEWAESREAGWNSIVSEYPNDDRGYTWQLPAKIPPRVHLRLTVRDAAGNESHAVTDEPILIDLNVPEVTNVQVHRPPG